MKAATVALNVAVSTIAGMALNFVITKFNEWRTAIETNAQKSKELSSSMTDLISQYKELGDKSGWDTDDFAQAKDLNAEILDLLKNQSAEMDKKLRKLDLENGKYTGIAGNSLDTGTYVVQVSGFNSSYTQLYSEIYSGVMSWYSGTTNSGNSSEIFLHNAGLADNNNAIYLRTLRVAGSKTLKLQIACKVAATGTDILTFKFRRLI